MKLIKLFPIIALISFNAVSQNSINVDLFQNFTHLHNLGEGTEVKNKLSLYSRGASLSYSINFQGDAYADPSVYVGIGKEISNLTDNDGLEIGETAGSQIAGAGVNLYRRVGKYVSVGAGIHLLMVSTKYTNPIDPERIDKISVTPSVPIVVRLYFPTAKRGDGIRLSFIGHLSTKAYLQAGIGYGF